jgi:hypothetical protein
VVGISVVVDCVVVVFRVVDCVVAFGVVDCVMNCVVAPWVVAIFAVVGSLVEGFTVVDSDAEKRVVVVDDEKAVGRAVFDEAVF